VLKELERLGTAQNRKVYGRHGVRPPVFGVSYKNLDLLTRRLKTNHALAVELWNSGIHDARVLATKLADPAMLDGPTAERWVKEFDNYVLTDAVAGLVARSKLARRKAEKWSKSKQEWIARAGWSVLAHLAMRDAELDDAYFAALVPQIEGRIHGAPNRARDAMNSALIAIGIRNAPLGKLALAAAGRIGKIEVDHGETGCKTPDAAQYIAKTVAYRRQKAAAR
jgi:3-methyladenine DNA glycosylase AlkD